MRWPRNASSSDQDERPGSHHETWTDNLNATDWSHYTQPHAVIPSLLFTAATLGLIRLYKSYLRRIPSVEFIKPDLFRRKSLFGRVTSVGDADNFRFFHTPGGRLAGWGWIPGRRVPRRKDELFSKTVSTHSNLRSGPSNC